MENSSPSISLVKSNFLSLSFNLLLSGLIPLLPLSLLIFSGSLKGGCEKVGYVTLILGGVAGEKQSKRMLFKKAAGKTRLKENI